MGCFLNRLLAFWKSGERNWISPLGYQRSSDFFPWYFNIPVFGNLWSKGKFVFFKKTDALKNLAVELSTAFLFFLSFLKFSENITMLVFSFIFTSFLVLLTISDLKWKLLPHPFNNLFILTGFVFRRKTPSFSGFFYPSTDFIIVGSLLLGVMLLFSRGLGGGDIKLISGLAVWFGITKTIYIIIFACFSASLIFFILLTMRKVYWEWMMPFGPFLAVGAFVLWLWPQTTTGLGLML